MHFGVEMSSESMWIPLDYHSILHFDTAKAVLALELDTERNSALDY